MLFDDASYRIHVYAMLYLYVTCNISCRDTPRASESTQRNANKCTYHPSLFYLIRTNILSSMNALRRAVVAS